MEDDSIDMEDDSIDVKDDSINMGYLVTLRPWRLERYRWAEVIAWRWTLRCVRADFTSLARGAFRTLDRP